MSIPSSSFSATQIKQFDIYDAQISLGMCDDPRPCLIVEATAQDRVGCLPISTQSYRWTAFPISDCDPSFAATGLSKNSFVLDERTVILPMNQLIKRRGRLEGNLLAEFRKRSGM